MGTMKPRRKSNENKEEIKSCDGKGFLAQSKLAEKWLQTRNDSINKKLLKNKMAMHQKSGLNLEIMMSKINLRVRNKSMKEKRQD